MRMTDAWLLRSQTQGLLPDRFFGSSSGTGFLRLALLPDSSSAWSGLEELVLPMGVVWPFFNTAWLNFPGSSLPAGSKRREQTDGPLWSDREERW